MIIIDTLDFLDREVKHFDDDEEQNNKRVTLQKDIFDILHDIKSLGVSIILINNTVSTMDGSEKHTVKPSMGDYYTQMVDERFKIRRLYGFDLVRFKGQAYRKLMVEFSDRIPMYDTAIFEIYDGGVKGVSTRNKNLE